MAGESGSGALRQAGVHLSGVETGYPAPRLEVRSIAAFAVAGHFFLTWALYEGGWHNYDPKALPMLVMAPAVWIAGLRWGNRSLSVRGGVWTLRFTWFLALTPVILGLFIVPGRHLRSPEEVLWPSYILHGLALLLFLSYLPELTGRKSLSLRIRRVRIVALFAVAAALGAWMISVTPEPPIDVWVIRQQGAELLLAGKSPYAEGIRAIDTHSHARYIETYVYPPLNLLLSTGAYVLTGETRWAQWASMILAAVMLYGVARRRAVPGELWPDFIAAALLFHPQSLHILSLSWGEPLALPFLVGTIWLLDRDRKKAACVSLGLLCSLKQYFLIYLPFLALLPTVGLGGTAIALATLTAVLLPFAIWAPAELWDALIVHHLENPFRLDSLSLTAFMARRGVELPTWTSFLAAAVVGLATLGLPRRAATLLLAVAVALTLFFALGRQAFQNYYYLVGATALLAASAAERPE